MGGAHKMDVPACSWALLFVAVLCVVPEATSVIGKESRRYISYIDGAVVTVSTDRHQLGLSHCVD